MADDERYADIGALETFIQSAPPGELGIVTSDIQHIFSGEVDLIDRLSPAFQRYHESQFAVVKLTGKNQTAIISKHNRLDDGRYFDVTTETSFVFDPISKSVSDIQPFELESKNAELIRALYDPVKSLSNNHHSTNSVAIFPVEGDSQIAVIIVANQYNSRNFWNGRWRSCYYFEPSTGILNGSIQLDIHYFEDGNVRFVTDKHIEDSTLSSSSPAQITQAIFGNEQRYHEALNKTFLSLSGGPLKELRPKLPVTKQKIDWDKIAMSKISHDLADLSFKSKD